MAALSNGDLLAAVESDGFELMLTVDPNLRYQQNLSRRRIAIVALSMNHWEALPGQIDRLIEEVARATEGSYEEVTFPRPRRPGGAGP